MVVAARRSNQAAWARLSVVSKTKTKAIIMKTIILFLDGRVEALGMGNGSGSMASGADCKAKS